MENNNLVSGEMVQFQPTALQQAMGIAITGSFVALMGVFGWTLVKTVKNSERGDAARNKRLANLNQQTANFLFREYGAKEAFDKSKGYDMEVRAELLKLIEASVAAKPAA
jgi:hypothetical protein